MMETYDVILTAHGFNILQNLNSKNVVDSQSPPNSY